jgi:hypothetical protein
VKQTAREVFGFDDYKVESSLMYFTAINFLIQKSRNIDKIVRHEPGRGKKGNTYGIFVETFLRRHVYFKASV